MLLKASLIYVLRLELIPRLRGWKGFFLRPGQSAAQHWIGLFGLDPNGLFFLVIEPKLDLLNRMAKFLPRG